MSRGEGRAEFVDCKNCYMFAFFIALFLYCILKTVVVCIFCCYTHFKVLICKQQSETLSTGNSKHLRSIVYLQFPVERVSLCFLQIIALKKCVHLAIVTRPALVSWESLAFFFIYSSKMLQYEVQPTIPSNYYTTIQHTALIEFGFVLYI